MQALKRLDDLTVKTSWSLVLAAFAAMLLLIGAVSGYANHHNRDAFRALDRAHQQRTDTLRDAYETLLRETRALSPGQAEQAADQVLSASRTALDGRVADFEIMANRLDAVLAGVLLASLVLVAVVLWGITVNVIQPLRRVAAHCERLAAGDLSEPVARRGGNEIGQLYNGLGRMRDNLAAIVGQVRASSDTILDGARHIAAGNGGLSARFEQLAAALEQTSASMEQLTATVANNDEHARRGDGLSQGASRVAHRGGEAVREVVATMDEIRQGAERIRGITDRIEGIAFQTDLLAINAAVEAARAGQHGRGFAVVAGEVRALSRNTAALAKEITELVGDTVQRIERGGDRVNQAGDTMSEMLDAVDQVTGIMAAIRVASGEQTQGIGQASQAVLEMDRVTQANVGLVADAARAAARLEGQADALRREMAVFVLAPDQAPAASVRRQASVSSQPRQASVIETP